jgi:GNAT superfamily N-acetyltransferase
MSVEIQHRLPTPSEFRSLRAQTDWGVPDYADTEKVLAHSFSGILAVENGGAIGMARTVGDGCLILYIQDVIIAESNRSQGLGRTLLQGLIDEAAKTCSPSCTVGLFAATGQSGFYKKLGYGTRNPPAYGPGMQATLSELAKANGAA